MITRPFMRWTGGALAVLALWFVAVVALTVIAEPTRAVIVFAPDRERMLTAIRSADVALLDGSERLLRVSGSSSGFVARLYASGALLVLPARPSGCTTPPRATPVRGQVRG